MKKYFLITYLVLLKIVLQAQTPWLEVSPFIKPTNEFDKVFHVLNLYFKTKDSNDRYQLWNPSDFNNLDLPDVYLNYFIRMNEHNGYSPIKPTLLYVGKESMDTYNTIISFSNPTLPHVQGVIDVIIGKYNGELKITNTLFHNLKIKQWKQESISGIKFNFPNRVCFNKKQVFKLVKFNSQMARTFGLEPISFTYIACTDFCEMQEIRGIQFDEDAVGGGGAQTDFDNRIIYVANGRFDYFHEVVHLYYYQNYKRTNLYNVFWSEALATYWGGSMEKTLDWHIKAIRQSREFNEYDFHDLENLNSIDSLPLTNVPYVIGGLLCRNIFQKLGEKNGLEKILSIKDMEQTYHTIEHTLGVKKNKLGEYLRDQIRHL